MARPGDRLEALLLYGLAAFDAESELPVLLAPQSRAHQDKKVAGAGALLEERFFRVATVGLVSHVLRPDRVGPAAVHLSSQNSAQKLPFFGQQPLPVCFRRSSGHRLVALSACLLSAVQSILGTEDRACQPVYFRCFRY